MVDIPTASRRNPCGQERKGQRLPRDPCDRNRTKYATICYHTRCIQSLSFVAFDNSICISSIRDIFSSLNLCFLLFSSMFTKSRMANMCNGFFPRASRLFFLSFCIHLFSMSISFLFLSRLSVSLLAFGSRFIFHPPLPLLPRLLSRCLLCQRLLSAASTAGLWYTGSMVSRYTPATAAPSPRPLGEPVRFPRCVSPGPAAPARPPPQSLPRCPLTTPLIRRTVLCRPSHAATTLLLARPQGCINYRFIGMPPFLWAHYRQTSIPRDESRCIFNDWVDICLKGMWKMISCQYTRVSNLKLVLRILTNVKSYLDYLALSNERRDFIPQFGVHK